jgi:hypothetical protein
VFPALVLLRYNATQCFFLAQPALRVGGPLWAAEQLVHKVVGPAWSGFLCKIQHCLHTCVVQGIAFNTVCLAAFVLPLSTSTDEQVPVPRHVHVSVSECASICHAWLHCVRQPDKSAGCHTMQPLLCQACLPKYMYSRSTAQCVVIA